ncbi:MAG: gliding motility protein GldC [Crocinitomicaceae bacterium]|nr:gliding motility protein GldC [Crocinitomicaceae bacterium]|tara:strand:- start:4298 stop:4633 length:336 start_codon:yes stop_codon:yes gene_type:complete
MSKKSEITFSIELDENHVPETIEWSASDNGEKGKCKATMLTMWDENEKNTLRIDLWTKDMPVDDMKLYTYQSMITMADTFARATGEDEIAKEMREFANKIGEKMDLVRKAN